MLTEFKRIYHPNNLRIISIYGLKLRIKHFISKLFSINFEFDLKLKESNTST